MPQGPKLFTCPKCWHQYLGHDPLPDCPRCGYDYREREGVRWDVFVYLLAILGLVSFIVVASYYRSHLGAGAADTGRSAESRHGPQEKLPGADAGRTTPFQSPYHEPGR